jgi:hypothetical protein
MKHYGIALVLTLAASTALAVAPPAGPRKDALAQAEARVGQLAGQTKGGPQQRLLLEREKIRRLIEDIDAGRHVDPSEIDRTLQDAERGF